MESKSYQVLRSNNEWLNTHIQLVDASLAHTKRTLKRHTVKDDSISSVLNHKNPEKYTCLNHPVRQSQSILKQSQNRIIEFAICQLYNQFIEYLHSIVYEIYKYNPKTMVERLCTPNVEKSISYFDVIRMGTYEKVEWHIVDAVFRGLVNLRDTPKLLSKVLTCADITGNIAKADIDVLMKYLELRHLFVHNKGRIDDRYVSRYQHLYDSEIKSGYKIILSYDLFAQMQEQIMTLCARIDMMLISHNIVSSRK